MNIYSNIIKPALFSLDPEITHDLILFQSQIMGKIQPVRKCVSALFNYENEMLSNEILGVKYANPSGLAAGFDKNGLAVRILSEMGFGFLEIGSISARYSKGNPKPRLFRLPVDNAIAVHYGAPSLGADKVSDILKKYNLKIPLGINIIKTNDQSEVSEDQIIEDYLYSIAKLYEYATYFTLNLSCPNVSQHNYFCQNNYLYDLLSEIGKLSIDKPFFLKISPTGGIEIIEKILTICDKFDFVAGFIYNLPTTKLNLKTDLKVLDKVKGAISGKPVEEIINEYIRETYERMDKQRYIIIGAGGIFSAQDAYLKIKSGASLVQIFTGMIYKGPGLIKEINKGLCGLLRKDGFKNIKEAIGVGKLN